jgi:hypothetical protein
MIPAAKIRIRVGSERDESVVMGRFQCLIHPFHRNVLKTGWLAGQYPKPVWRISNKTSGDCRNVG